MESPVLACKSALYLALSPDIIATAYSFLTVDTAKVALGGTPSTSKDDTKGFDDMPRGASSLRAWKSNTEFVLATRLGIRNRVLAFSTPQFENQDPASE